MSARRRQRRARGTRATDVEPTVPGVGSTPSEDRRRRLLAGCVLVLFVLVAYGPVYQAGFIWDDDQYVTENPVLRDAEGLARIWAEPTATPQYYPLVHTSFWIEYQLWELAPAGYHAVNVLLHGLASLFLWRVLRRLEVPGAFVAAAVFALHPVQVESVAWVTERKNVLAGVFFFASVMAFLRFHQSSTGRESGRRRWYVLSVLLFLAALLSKTVTAMLPPVLVLLVWWREDSPRWRSFLPLVPYVVLGAPLALVTVVMERVHVGAVGEEWALSFADRLVVASRALWFYAGKLLWPHPLIFTYPRWEVDGADPVQLLPLVAWLAVVVLLWRLRHRIGAGPLVAVLSFSVLLSPALGFFNVFPMRFSFVADHFQYLASAALLPLVVAAAVLGLRRVGAPPRVRSAAAAGLLVVLAVLTWQRSTVYEDAEILWRDTARQNPEAWIAHNNLGAILVAQRQYDEALQRFERALELKPDLPQAHFNVAEILEHRQEWARAEEHRRALVEINPKNVAAWVALGRLGLLQRQYESAASDLRQALAVAPEEARAHFLLGRVRQEQKRHQDAVRHFADALAIDPDDAGALYYQAHSLDQVGREREAVEALDRTLAVEPSNPGPYALLARILATSADPTLRDPARAVEIARVGCELTDFEQVPFLEILAEAQVRAGDRAGAIETLERAVAVARSRGESAFLPRLASRLEALRGRG